MEPMYECYGLDYLGSTVAVNYPCLDVSTHTLSRQFNTSLTVSFQQLNSHKWNQTVEL